MKRERRYLVFKLKDVREALTEEERRLLLALADKVSEYRYDKGKPRLDCVVVESDWPEYEPTWRAIEKRMDETQQEG